MALVPTQRTPTGCFAEGGGGCVFACMCLGVFECGFNTNICVFTDELNLSRVAFPPSVLVLIVSPLNHLPTPACASGGGSDGQGPQTLQGVADADRGRRLWLAGVLCAVCEYVNVWLRVCFNWWIATTSITILDSHTQPAHRGSPWLTSCTHHQLMAHNRDQDRA